MVTGVAAKPLSITATVPTLSANYSSIIIGDTLTFTGSGYPNSYNVTLADSYGGESNHVASNTGTISIPVNSSSITKLPATITFTAQLTLTNGYSTYTVSSNPVTVVFGQPNSTTSSSSSGSSSNTSSGTPKLSASQTSVAVGDTITFTVSGLTNWALATGNSAFTGTQTGSTLAYTLTESSPLYAYFSLGESSVDIYAVNSSGVKTNTITLTLADNSTESSSSSSSTSSYAPNTITSNTMQIYSATNTGQAITIRGTNFADSSSGTLMAGDWTVGSWTASPIGYWTITLYNNSGTSLNDAINSSNGYITFVAYGNDGATSNSLTLSLT